MDSRIDYDEFAKDYSIHRNASKRVIMHIIGKLRDFNIGDFLEIGCGTADHLYALKRLMRKEAYGFDRPREMIREGRQKIPGLT